MFAAGNAPRLNFAQPDYAVSYRSAAIPGRICQGPNKVHGEGFEPTVLAQARLFYRQLPSPIWIPVHKGSRLLLAVCYGWYLSARWSVWQDLNLRTPPIRTEYSSRLSYTLM